MPPRRPLNTAPSRRTKGPAQSRGRAPMRGILRSLPSQPTINSSARIGNRFIPRPDEMVSYGGGVFDADRPCPLMTAKSGADSVLNAPVEVKERKDRVVHALHATRPPVEEGLLPGGRGAPPPPLHPIPANHPPNPTPNTRLPL